MRLEYEDVREPHWHPNAVGELNSVSSGRALTTIFILGINMDRFEVGLNEIVFIPSRYFHCTKTINSNEDMQFAIFFNEKRLEDIGISGALGAYSNKVLGSIIGLEYKILVNYQSTKKTFSVYLEVECSN